MDRRLFSIRGTVILTLAAITKLALAQAPLPTHLDLPPRSTEAPGASRLMAITQNLTPAERDEFLAREVLAGNIPESLRTLSPFSTELGARPGHPVQRLTMVCTPDYLAVGSDADALRIPLRPGTAQQIADKLSCTLPTRRLVNAIADHATIRLRPLPISPKLHRIETPEVWQLHESLLQNQYAWLAHDAGTLRRGLKKDIVVTNLLDQRPLPERVAIYGWHWPEGQPIQPLSLVHDACYMDYSHGTRLIHRTAALNNRIVDLHQIMAHPTLNPLASDEGPIRLGRYPTAVPARRQSWTTSN